MQVLAGKNANITVWGLGTRGRTKSAVCHQINAVERLHIRGIGIGSFKEPFLREQVCGKVEKGNQCKVRREVLDRRGSGADEFGHAIVRAPHWPGVVATAITRR